jgi:hypothetical protein
VRSCLIDGEAVACDENGLAVFERLRRKPTGKHVFLYAFDLLDRLLRHVDQIPAYTKESEGVGTWAIAEPGACDTYDQRFSGVDVHSDRLARDKEFSSCDAVTTWCVGGRRYEMAKRFVAGLCRIVGDSE